MSNKCSDLIVGQRQKSSQDKSRNKELTFFTECLTRQSLAEQNMSLSSSRSRARYGFPAQIIVSMMRYYQDQIDRSLDLGSQTLKCDENFRFYLDFSY